MEGFFVCTTCVDSEGVVAVWLSEGFWFMDTSFLCNVCITLPTIAPPAALPTSAQHRATTAIRRPQCFFFGVFF